MKRSPKSLIVLVLIVLSILAAGLFIMLTTPRPIVSNPNESAIIQIAYSPQDSDEMIYLEDYNEQEILVFLASCQERWSLKSSDTIWYGEVQLTIWLHDFNYGTKEIVLGNSCFSQNGRNPWRYQIIDANNIKLTLFQLLQLQP